MESVKQRWNMIVADFRHKRLSDSKKSSQFIFTTQSSPNGNAPRYPGKPLKPSDKTFTLNVPYSDRLVSTFDTIPVPRASSILNSFKGVAGLGRSRLYAQVEDEPDWEHSEESRTAALY